MCQRRFCRMRCCAHAVSRFKGLSVEEMLVHQEITKSANQGKD